MKPVSFLAFDGEFVRSGNAVRSGRISPGLCDDIYQQIPSARLSKLRKRAHDCFLRFLVSSKWRVCDRASKASDISPGQCRTRGGLSDDCPRCGRSCRLANIGTCPIRRNCPRNYRRQHRNILRIQIDDSRSWIRTAHRVVAEEIEHWSNGTVGCLKIQCRETGDRGHDTIAKFSYIAESMIHYVCIWRRSWGILWPVGPAATAAVGRITVFHAIGEYVPPVLNNRRMSLVLL